MMSYRRRINNCGTEFHSCCAFCVNTRAVRAGCGWCWSCCPMISHSCTIGVISGDIAKQRSGDFKDYHFLCTLDLASNNSAQCISPPSLPAMSGKETPSSRCSITRQHSNSSLVYVDKPQTLDHLEDNIRRVIADMRPQMLEKVIENWTSRLDLIRASRDSHMP
ncbi:hypothetical protein TNCV_1745081 [Trichonephila clavipes]|nr:hypothetical protein TNCV_1745081 [Trichonephila clavipes]